MDANERTLLRAKAITEPLIGKALAALDAAEAERDAWRAATGLRGLSPQAAGAQIDREDDERDALKEALTPSGETKGAYRGEFKWTEEGTDEDGEQRIWEMVVPWTTVKDIMYAIRARAEAAKGANDVSL